MVYIDEIDVDHEGIAEMILDENAIAQVPRKYLLSWVKGRIRYRRETFVCIYISVFYINTYIMGLPWSPSQGHNINKWYWRNIIIYVG